MLTDGFKIAKTQSAVVLEADRTVPVRQGSSGAPK
jgi:hypothetical protein